MQLLIQRGQQQAQWTGKPVFDLWAKFELTPEEEELIRKYSMKKFALVEGDLWRDFFLATKVGGVIALVAIAVLTFQVGPVLALFGGVIFFAFGSFGIYQQVKERILVSEMLRGKRFTCKSVATLIAKEKMLTELAQSFRYFLDAMKTWGGREVIDIELGQVPRLRVIEQVHGAA